MGQVRRTGSGSPARIDRGVPGASARAEFQRRRRADDQVRQQIFGRALGSVVTFLCGYRQSTSAWDLGGRGEARVGHHLNRAVGPAGVVLHDRAIPGTRANIDHIAVVASGIWVIDTKAYRGRVQRRNVGGWLRSEAALFIDGRDHTDLIPAVRRQAARVGRVAATFPMHASLCFADAEWGPLARPFTIDGVTVTWTARLTRTLRGPGPLSDTLIRTLAQRVATAFPPYEIPGTARPGATWPR